MVRHLRAQALLSMGSKEDALAEAEQVVELEPNRPEAHLVLAMAAWEQERLELTQRAFERGLELSDRAPELLARYAWFLACERGPRMAVETAEEALQMAPASVMARSALALAQLRQHKFRAAEQSVREATRLDPDDIHARSVELALLEQQGRINEAEALAEQLVDRPGLASLAASVKHEAKRRRLARKLLERGPIARAMRQRGTSSGEPGRTRYAGANVVLGMFGAALLALAAAVAIFPMLRWQPALAGLLCLLIPLVLLLWWFRD
jgi:tetratricopeptide (TPR) repeat protein